MDSRREKYKLNQSLKEAYKRNDLKSVQRIVQNFPDPKYAHNNQIYWGIQYGDETEVESLLKDSKTDFNWTNVGDPRWSLLHKAAYCNKVSTLKMILKHGGDVNIQDHLNQTPIFYCTSTQAIQLLLDNGGHLQHKDIHGDTPIHMAVYDENEEVLQMLIHHGSNLDTRNNWGQTALDLANKRGHENCVKILKEAMKNRKDDKHLDKPDDKSTVTKKQEVSLPDDIKREIFKQDEANVIKQDETIPDDIEREIFKQDETIPGTRPNVPQDKKYTPSKKSDSETKCTIKKQEDAMPESISKPKHNTPDKSNRQKTSQDDQKEHEKFKTLLQLACRGKSTANGIAIVIGISGPEGIELDIKNMSSTFEELNFAVFSQSNLTSSELVSLLNVASHFVYPLSYKFIVFYFAGHGGVDNGQAYVVPLQLQETKDPEKVYIEESIVSQFSSEKSPSLQYRFRILLFDCCLTTPSTRNDPSIKSEKFSLEARGGCLVAYATSRSYKSEGDMKRGGLWTHHLHQNLKLPLPISVILDRTHDAVKKESIASGRVQEPNYHSCIGEVYLKGDSEIKLFPESTSTITEGTRPNVPQDKKYTPSKKSDSTSHEVCQNVPDTPLEESDSISYHDLLDKPPETKDVFASVKDISALWNELGREFDVPENDRATLKRNINLSDEDRLESVIAMWITNETKDVKWRVVLEALKALRRKDIARKVIMYLQKSETYTKYISKDNFFPLDF